MFYSVCFAAIAERTLCLVFFRDEPAV
ncbi:hypothetical protein AYI69_g10767, partial [Smittium culicis]